MVTKLTAQLLINQLSLLLQEDCPFSELRPEYRKEIISTLETARKEMSDSKEPLHLDRPEHA